MIMEKDVDKLINTNRFVWEPVYKLSDSIVESKSKKVIITGGRKVGKSTVLKVLEKRSLNKNKQTVYMQFDLCMGFRQNKFLNTHQFIEHYYELELCLKLLYYVKNNYPLVYDKLIDYEVLLMRICVNTDRFINNSYYEEIELSRYLKRGELSSLMIDKIKKILDIDNLNVSFDRFDYLNHSDKYTQCNLGKYSDLFDKMIITIDDEIINHRKFRDRLVNDGYDVINVSYATDINIVKNIIKRRVRYFIIKNNYQFNVLDLMTDYIYEYLIQRCHGNIELMLKAIYNAISLREWTDSTTNFIALFIDCINKAVKEEKEYQKIYTKPKFYL